jgi:hydrogenase maturation protease
MFRAGRTASVVEVLHDVDGTEFLAVTVDDDPGAERTSGTAGPATSGWTRSCHRTPAMPDRVDVVDYGIRGVHLAYDLLDGRHGALVLADALPMNEPPGTVAVVEVDLNDPQWTDRDSEPGGEAPDGHGLDPRSCLRLVARLGAPVGRVVVVGCQPETVAEGMALSPPVQAAIEPARELVARIAGEEAARIKGPDELGEPGKVRSRA